MKNQFRQGDVFLDAVKALPAGGALVPLDRGRLILAYGEVTGHAHAVYPEVSDKPKAKPVMPGKLWDAGAERFLQIMEKTALKHEEHTQVDLDPGVYKVIRQREYAPEDLAKQRMVAD